VTDSGAGNNETTHHIQLPRSIVLCLIIGIRGSIRPARITVAWEDGNPHQARAQRGSERLLEAQRGLPI